MEQSLGKAGQAFSGAITEGSQLLLENLRIAATNVRVAFPSEFDMPVKWASLLFLLHLTDRFALASLQISGRELFMGALLKTLARDEGNEFLRISYNEAQLKFGKCRSLVPEKDEGWGGTVCWEFAKQVASHRCAVQPHDCRMACSNRV